MNCRARLQLDEQLTPVETEDLLLHDLAVVYRISNIDVRFIWHMCHGRIEIQDVRRCVFGVEIRVEALHEGCLALFRAHTSKRCGKRDIEQPYLQIQPCQSRLHRWAAFSLSYHLRQSRWASSSKVRAAKVRLLAGIQWSQRELLIGW